MCLGEFLLGSNFFGTVWASWACMSRSFTRLGKFSFIICSNKFSISHSSSSPSVTPMIQMSKHLKLSQRFLSLSSFFWILVSSFCSSWMFSSFFPNCWCESQFPSLHCCFPVYCPIFHFVQPSFLPSSCNWTQSLLWASWLPVFWTLPLVGYLSSCCLVLFSGVLICSFIWAVFLCLSTPVVLEGAEP